MVMGNKMKQVLKSMQLLIILIISMHVAYAHCTDLKKPSGITGQCAKTHIEREYKKCQDQAESKNSFCTNPDQIVEAALHIQFVADQEKCRQDAKTQQSSAQKGYIPANKVIGQEACECLREGLGNYDAREMARNLKLSGVMDALFPTLAASNILDINIANVISGAIIAVGSANKGLFFHDDEEESGPLEMQTGPLINCPKLMEELAFKKAVADGNVAYGLSFGYGELERLPSLVGSMTSGSLSRLWVAMYQRYNLTQKPFEFNKWKYFDDQSQQYAQCGKQGFLVSGTKCQTDPPPESTVTAGFGSTSDIFCDNQGSCQDLTRIPKSTRLIFASIHMILPVTNNIFALRMGPNKGIQTMENAVRIDGGGITSMDIRYSEGQIITDQRNNILWPLLGSTTYYGSGTDAYETNTAIWDLSSAVMVVTTNQEDDGLVGKSGAKLTGMQGYSPSFFTTGVTFNHYYLSNFLNAVDVGSNGDGFSILAQGNADLAIFGFGGYFPFLNRKVLKGDSVIVKNQNVSVATGYRATDKTYSYLIFPIDETTKVLTAEAKIIEDSTGIPRQLSNRQRALIFSEGEASVPEKDDLTFE